LEVGKPKGLDAEKLGLRPEESKLIQDDRVGRNGQRTRSSLAVLLVALGEGARQYVQDEFAGLGSNVLIITPGKSETTGMMPPMAESVHKLTFGDSEAIRQRARGVKDNTPIVFGSSFVKYRQRRRDTTVIGTTSSFPEVRNIYVDIGSFISDDDVRTNRRIVVIGRTVKKELFGSTNPLGKLVNVGGTKCRVVGIMEEKGMSLGFDIDDLVFIPVTTAQELFNTDALLEILNATREDDFGRDIIPRVIDTHRVYAYPYGKFNKIQDYVTVTLESGERHSELVDRTRDSGYWRDVGTLDQYWNANMDLTGVTPYFNLYGRLWPIHTNHVSAPPAKFVFATERKEAFRVGKALDSIVSHGCIISGIVRNSVLSYNVIIRSWSAVDESVILDDVVVERHCKIKKAIIDKYNVIPPATEIGYNPEEDRKRFTVTPRGIVVVPKGHFNHR